MSGLLSQEHANIELFLTFIQKIYINSFLVFFFYLKRDIYGIYYPRYMPLVDMTKADGKKSKELDGPPQPEKNMYWDPAEM